MVRYNLLTGVALAFLLVSCSSDYTRSFNIRSIDTEGLEVPSVILVEGDVQPDPDDPEQPLVTNDPEKPLKVSFRVRDDGSLDSVELRVRALRRDPETKKLVPGSWKTEPNPYLMTESTRRLRYTDPEAHLFILRRNPDFQ